jgi:mannose-6-phosphate isomerase-like protein (cupin superfamily)
MNVVNLARAFAKFSEHWSPKIAAEFNGQRLKLAKLKGEFIWHEHSNEDELFLVVRGSLRIRLEQGEVVLHEGDLTVIPRGTRHLPIAEEEVHVILLEPASTVSTGDEVDGRATRGEWL